MLKWDYDRRHKDVWYATLGTGIIHITVKFVISGLSKGYTYTVNGGLPIINNYINMYYDSIDEAKKGAEEFIIKELNKMIDEVK